ncbi:hypothetical protein TRFO_19705 [Tritrichomonas foetus]|uniref:Uncharacterized protein n=1 Tax=Tritrichomonas foetus TaxID=1144522 RepID=A0A1J4KIZ1_9EUKA|nr:hypothetical protein TRFO_19705 [Tritrichomonas foetus]|eukprot:OHT10904.1 hypothetical protein TRFO_19705 [Tritrichomonas foetus]
MGVFGKDPRSIFLHMIHNANLWYDTLLIPVLFIALMKRFNRNDSLYLPLPHFVVEIIRVCLHTGHTHGNIAVSIVFLIFDILAIALDFLNIFLVEQNTAFFNLVMIAFAILHIIQLFTIIPVFRSLHFYKTGYYQFSRGQLQAAQEADDTVQLMDIEHESQAIH